MKKYLLTGSCKKMFLAFAILVSFVGNVMAQITVTTDADGVVTITTTKAGEIGKYENYWYQWNSDVTVDQQTAIKNATGLKFKGIINSNDMKTIVDNCKNSDNVVTWTKLDMGEATFEGGLTTTVSGDNISEHCFLPQNYYKISCKLLILPLTEDGIIPARFSGHYNINDIRELVIPDGYKTIGDQAFYNGSISFKNLTFPATIESIGHQAFVGGINDIYFLGKKAPKVPYDAFDTKAYLNNNAVKLPDATTKFTVTRENYYNNGYCASILHLRSDLTKAERAAFTDVTRKYHVFAQTKKITDANGNTETLIIPASKEQEEITVDVNGAEIPAIKCGDKDIKVKYGNIDVIGCGTIAMTAPVNTAWYDTNLGEQVIWPSQVQFCRSYAVANNGLLWNGESTIGDGIRAAGDKSYSGDGSEYIGLHEFVLVSYDVKNEEPEHWEFSNINGENWYTICVPVKMTVKQVRESFGDETQVCKFHNVERNSDVKVRLYFTDEQCLGVENENEIAIEANNAYMIRPSKYKDANEKFVLKDYELSDKVYPVPTIKTVADGGVNAHVRGGHSTYTFIGNYQMGIGENGEATPLYMPKYSYYLGNAGNNIHKLFFQVGETGKWKPYTCVILVDNFGQGSGEDDYRTFFNGSTSNTSGSKGCSSFFGEDNNTTGIDDIEIYAGKNLEKVNAIFSIDGKMVNSNGDASQLSKGIYVKNGKKFIVK